MVILSIVIVFALLVTMVLPIVLGFWTNKRLGIAWRIMLYGAMAYFIAQALITLIFSGFVGLVENGTLAMSDQAYEIAQLALSVFLVAVIGVLVRWLGMKFIDGGVDTLEETYGFGFGYGGIESLLLVGFPLLITFITMLSNINIDPETTTLDADVVAQLEELWQVQPYTLIAGSVERILGLLVHLTVTVLILQVFKRKNPIWLLAAVGDDLLVNGIVVCISETGLGSGWSSLISLILAAGNIYLLYRLNAFKLHHKTDEESKQTNSDGLNGDHKEDAP